MRYALAAAILISACGGSGDFTHGRPKITALRGPNQTGAFKVEFGISFFDTDQDLGTTGSLHLLIDDQEAPGLMLADLFDAAAPALPHDAVQGTFGVVVDLCPTVGPCTTIKPGDTVKIGFYLLDASGQKSNIPTVVLQATMTGG